MYIYVHVQALWQQQEVDWVAALDTGDVTGDGSNNDIAVLLADQTLRIYTCTISSN